MGIGAICFSETVAKFYHIIGHYILEGILTVGLKNPTVNTLTVTEVTEFDFRFS
jgi:hypothetical protein